MFGPCRFLIWCAKMCRYKFMIIWEINQFKPVNVSLNISDGKLTLPNMELVDRRQKLLLNRMWKAIPVGCKETKSSLTWGQKKQKSSITWGQKLSPVGCEKIKSSLTWGQNRSRPNLDAKNQSPPLLEARSYPQWGVKK